MYRWVFQVLVKIEKLEVGYMKLEMGPEMWIWKTANGFPQILCINSISHASTNVFVSYYTKIDKNLD